MRDPDSFVVLSADLLPDSDVLVWSEVTRLRDRAGSDAAGRVMTRQQHASLEYAEEVD